MTDKVLALGKIDESKLVEVAIKGGKGEIKGVEDLAKVLGISKKEALVLMMEKDFHRFLHKAMLAQSEFSYYTRSLSRLTELAESEDGQVSIAAIKEQGSIHKTNVKGQTSPVVHIHLEGMLDELKKREGLIDIEAKFPGLD